MKKAISILLITLFVVGCSKVGKNEYLITGTAKGIENGKNVILQVQDDNGMPKAIDTVKIKDGKFEIKGKITEPTLSFIMFPDSNNGFPLVLENGEITVDIAKDSIPATKAKGTFNNDEMVKTLPEITKLDKQLQEKLNAYKMANAARIKTAQEKQDVAEFAKLESEIMPMVKENAKFYFDYVEKNPKSFVSLLFFNKLMNFAKTDGDKITKLFNGLDKSVKDTKLGKKINDALKQINAPVAPMPTAQPVSPSPKQ